MIEFKLEDGSTKLVPPQYVDQFKLEFPNATKVDEPGKINDSAIADPTAESNVMGSELVSGSFEQPEISAWQNIKNNLLKI